MRQIVLDTETTGLNPQDGHRIIEIGCIELIDRKLTGNNFHKYINPGKQTVGDSFQVHGISDAFLADKPFFAEIAEQLFVYLAGGELVIHNAKFDMRFLNHEFSQLAENNYSLATTTTVIDTLELAKKKHPGQRNSLDALCKRYEIDNSSRTLHGALLDAELLAEVYLHMTGGQCKLLQNTDGETTTSIMQHKKLDLSYAKKTQLVIKANSKELESHKNAIEELNCDPW